MERYSVSMLFTKSEQLGSSVNVKTRLACKIVSANSGPEAFGIAYDEFTGDGELKTFELSLKLVVLIPELKQENNIL